MKLTDDELEEYLNRRIPISSQFCDGETNKLAVHFDVVNIVRELLAARKVIEAAREVDVFDDATLEKALEAYDALGVKS